MCSIEEVRKIRHSIKEKTKKEIKWGDLSSIITKVRVAKERNIIAPGFYYEGLHFTVILGVDKSVTRCEETNEISVFDGSTKGVCTSIPWGIEIPIKPIDIKDYKYEPKFKWFDVEHKKLKTEDVDDPTIKGFKPINRTYNKELFEELKKLTEFKPEKDSGF